MTDLLTILPSFPQRPFAALLPTIEQHRLSTTDLLALHPADIAKQTQLPLLDLKRLIAAIQVSLSDDLVPQYPLQQSSTPSRGRPTRPPEGNENAVPEVADTQANSPLAEDAEPLAAQQWPRPHLISTLDAALDDALGGGIPTASITEFTGESGAGKTQFLLTLCLAVQLAPPRGLSRKALYISTESGLATGRLSQMLSSLKENLPPSSSSSGESSPSLDNILSTVTPDLESQDHILEYQVPVLLSRHSIGLVVIDSVAANYRAEFERAGSSRGSNMAARSAALVRLGALLRDLARRHDIAVVVANQVADRFPSSVTTAQDVPLHSSSGAAPFPSSSPPPPPSHPALRLDHQQRWFTGWGDDPRSTRALKTPSLGLVWSTQISCRIALLKRPVYGRPRRTAGPIEADDGVEVGATLRSWRRWMKVVFASHAAASRPGIEGATEFEVTSAGVRSVQPKVKDDKQA